MDFDEVRTALKVIYKEYQKLQDELAIMKRHYENEFANIGATVDTSGDVNKVLSSSDSESDYRTSIVATAKGINTEVSKTHTNIEIVNVFNEAEAKIDLVYFDESTELYHYYDSNKKIWLSTDSDTFTTVFEQTSDGFDFDGNVGMSQNLYLGDFQEEAEKSITFNGAGKIYSFDGGYGYYTGVGVSASHFKVNAPATSIYLQKEGATTLQTLKEYINSSEVVARFA